MIESICKDKLKTKPYAVKRKILRYWYSVAVFEAKNDNFHSKVLQNNRYKKGR